MSNRWLIRTNNNQILGPVSREKVLKLIKDKLLKGDDELSAGNSYWFGVREHDLVQKFLIEDVHPGANPISEAVDTISPPKGSTSVFKIEELKNDGSSPNQAPPSTPESNDTCFPSDQDLEYPSIPGAPQVSEKVGTEISSEEPELYPEDADLEYPSVEMSGDPLTPIEEPTASSAHENTDTPVRSESERPNLSLVEEADPDEPVMPDDSDLEYPDMPSSASEEKKSP